jgi:hypothetical protein
MRFACVCEFARVMSHARSMQRKRCLCLQLGMAGTASMGTRRARHHSTGTHGMDCACRCDRAARLACPVRDVDSCTADELHVGLQCCGDRILVQRRRRETPVRCFSTPSLTERLHSRRCGRRPLPKRLHSIRNPARSGSQATPFLVPEFGYYLRVPRS